MPQSPQSPLDHGRRPAAWGAPSPTMSLPSAIRLCGHRRCHRFGCRSGWVAAGKAVERGTDVPFPHGSCGRSRAAEGGGGDRFCPAETHTATADGMAGRPSARPCPRHLVPAHLPPGEHGQRGRVSTAVLTRPHPRGQPDGSRRRPRPARFPPREGHPRSRTAKRRQPGCFACPS